MANETKEEREQRLNTKTTAPVPPSPTPPAKYAGEMARPAPKIRWKGDLEFKHDLVRLKVSTMQKNVSYKKYQPNLEEVQHEHFFHSVDMKGRPNRYCQAVGGHFHEVTMDWNNPDENGDPTITVGPALREVDVKSKATGKVRKRVEKVRFASGMHDGNVDGGPEDDEIVEVSYMYDTHTHKAKYEGSEMISPNRLQKQQDQDRAKIQSLIAAQPRTLIPGEGSGNKGAAGDEGERLNAEVADGARIVED